MRLLFVTPLVLVVGCASTSGATVEADQLTRSIDALRAQVASQEQQLEALRGRVDVLSAAGPRERTNTTMARDTRDLEVVKLSPNREVQREPEEEEPVMLEITGEGDKLQVVKMPAAPRKSLAKSTTLPPRPMTTVSAKPDTTSDAAFAEALQLYRDGRADAAFAQFADIVKKNPKSDKAAAALYWMGESRFDQQRYSDAIEQYRRLVDGYPLSSKSAEAMLKTGICYERLNDPNRAREAFQRLVDQHPQSAVAELARARPGVQGRSK